MRVAILTSDERGFASLCLDQLARTASVEIAAVILNIGTRPTSRKRRYKRTLRKVRKIGILGAANGVRMRSWYREDVERHIGIENIRDVALKHGLRVFDTPGLNSKTTGRLMLEARAQLGLSLGNGYITEHIYTIPEFGMINVHHELLPEYRGAQSVIWQIHDGSATTGYTIHEIDKEIDAGRILLRQEVQIIFDRTLRQTVSLNVARLFTLSAEALPSVVGEYSRYAACAERQRGGRRFTTPTICEFMRMTERHRQLREYSLLSQKG